VEKRKPSYLLSNVLAIVAARGVDAFSAAALHGAWNLGLTSDEAVAVVLGLRQTDFYKSMTTHADHRIWQDVRLSRRSEFGLAGLYQTDAAREWQCRHSVQGKMR
jgi:motility quorum-sensing regulator/GCU-specific mRNA interferase toxin